MNRRGFIAAIGGAIAGAMLPAPMLGAAQHIITIDNHRLAKKVTFGVLDQSAMRVWSRSLWIAASQPMCPLMGEEL